MKGKSGKGPPSTDLLVCFPTRAHLTLMPPKSINSPIRPPSESSSHHHNHHHHQKQPLPSRHHRRGRSFGVGQSSSSPTLWSKNKPNNNDISEPTSPKVTCAGQIKVRPKSNGSSCKNWQSVMEQIERIQNTKKQKKKPNWVESLGLKKDVMQFLTCMRNIRFDFRCFGAFPTTAISSDDEDDEEDEDEDEDDHINNVDHQEKQHGGLPQFRNTGGVGEEEEDDDKSSRTYFSKWYMVLQDDTKKEKTFESYRKSTSDEIIAPPPNALLLMRCRSAPPKSWLEEREEDEEEEKKKVVKEEEKTEEAAAMDDHKIEKNENMILRYGAGEHDLYKFSSDIAKETWVVGGIKGSLSRSRSWKS